MHELQRLKDIAISDSGFVFDPYTGNTFSINATGRAIVEGLRLGHGREEIVAMLRERFETAALPKCMSASPRRRCDTPVLWASTWPPTNS